MSFEVDQLDRVDGRQGVEERPALGRLGIDTVDRFDAHQAPILLAVLGGADDAADAVAGAKAGASDLGGRDIDVIRAGHQTAPAHEAVAVVDDVEDAGGVRLAAALDLALEDFVDQVVLAHVARISDVQIAADLDQLVEVLVVEFVDIHCLLFASFGYG